MSAADPHNTTDAFFVGQRVALDHNSRGTIRFVGPVPPTKGLWLGIEWDDVDRGKHSGEKDGVQYFQTRVPGSATFIRPSNRLSSGTSFISALRDKYTASTEPGGSLDDDSDVRIIPNTTFSRDIEVVGMDKIGKKFADTTRIREVGLEDQGISRASDGEDLAEELEDVASVNLANNLLPSLEEVGKVAACLRGLKDLVLNANRFEAIRPGQDLSGLSGIRALFLNKTMITWSEVLSLLRQLPDLRSLHVSACSLSSLSPAPAFGHDLVELELSSNGLKSWREILEVVRMLLRLEKLDVSSNSLSLPIQSDSLATAPAQSVRTLGISDNQLSDWREIDAIALAFPNLLRISVSNNPLLNGTDERAARLQLIARLPSLKTLENSEVKPLERQESERFYWSLIEKEAGTPEQRGQRHLQYENLRRRFAETVAAPVAVTPAANTLKKRLLTLHISAPGHVTAGPVPISVLPSTPLRLLRAKLSKTIGRPCTKGKAQVWTVTQDERGGTVRTELQDDSRDLSFYGLGDGDLLEVTDLSAGHNGI